MNLSPSGEKVHSESGGSKHKGTTIVSAKKKGKDEIVFLHLSDIHLDRQYSEVSEKFLAPIRITQLSWQGM